MSNPGPAWQPSGVVSLTTDFGLIDPYVGIMHGVILERGRARCGDDRTQAAGLRVVDLTHGVPAQDVRTAAFHLRQGWSWFPPGTVHVAVVDPGVGSARRILVALDRGHAFVAPDNGLLGPVLSAQAEVCVLEVERFALERISRTFHGRDVFSPTAAALATGVDPREAGSEGARVAWADCKQLHFPEPRTNAWPDGRLRSVDGEILVVDRFGNLITNVPGELLTDPSGAGAGAVDRAPGRWRAVLAGRSVPVAGTYAEVLSGSPLALVDSLGYWEVAVRDGSAAAELGLSPGAPVRFERIDER